MPDAHNMARLDVHHHTYARLWRELPASLVLLFRIGLHIVERKAGMEPLVEPLGRERRLCARVLSSGRRRGCPQSVPAELEPLDGVLRGLVKERVTRGHVEVTVSLQRTGAKQSSLIAFTNQ